MPASSPEISALLLVNPWAPAQVMVYGAVPPVIVVLIEPVLPPLHATFCPNGSIAGLSETVSVAGSITFQLWVRVHAASVIVKV